MNAKFKKDLQDLLNNLFKVDEEQTRILKELQEMSADFNLPRYCSWEGCAYQLFGHKELYTKNGCNCTYEARAKVLLNKFFNLQGKYESAWELGRVLADNNFWK